MFLDKYIEEYGLSTDYPIFDGKDYKDIVVPSKDLFLAQFKENNFNAIDIIIKYLAIENYFGLNGFGFELYNKTQSLRTGKNWEKRFKALIESISKGYDNESHIETDLNYSIHDGAHRVALALFFNQDNLPLRLFNTFLYRRPYDLGWFYENDFSKEELDIIKTKLNELLEKVSEPYYCILWPPARQLFDEIQNRICQIDSSISIVSSEDIIIPKDDFKKFIYDVYSTDDIRLEKLDIKYCKMMSSLQNGQDNLTEFPIKVLKIKMTNPRFRVKPLTGLPQSKVTMELKKAIRDEFKYLIIDYYYDIIMHMTDNSKQNDDVEKIMKKVRRI